jgi:hypothetical protein
LEKRTGARVKLFMDAPAKMPTHMTICFIEVPDRHAGT